MTQGRLSRSCDPPAGGAGPDLAEAKGVVVSGTIGILLKGVAADVLALAEADRLLAEMISHGYRAPVRLLREPLTD